VPNEGTRVSDSTPGPSAPVSASLASGSSQSKCLHGSLWVGFLILNRMVFRSGFGLLSELCFLRVVTHPDASPVVWAPLKLQKQRSIEACDMRASTQGLGTKPSPPTRRRQKYKRCLASLASLGSLSALAFGRAACQGSGEHLARLASLGSLGARFSPRFARLAQRPGYWEGSLTRIKESYRSNTR
jgi:hypothetical protein